MSSAEKQKEALQEVRRSFQRAEGDCGSSEVQGNTQFTVDIMQLNVACQAEMGVARVQIQTSINSAAPWLQQLDVDHMVCCCAVAVLTAKIKAMAEHMKVHRKDYHSRRGLDAMLSQRRSLLQYLRRKDFDSYAITLSRLGLKDNYMKLVSTP